MINLDNKLTFDISDFDSRNKLNSVIGHLPESSERKEVIT